MRALFAALFLSFAALAQDPQSLQDEARALIDQDRYEEALVKLEAANRAAPAPELLLAIARCHRELAYQRVREAARMRPTEPVMRELAQSLDELAPEPPRLSRERLPQVTVSAAAVPRAEEAAPHVQPLPRRTILIASTAAGSVVLLAAAGLAHAQASSLAGGLSDPTVVDKAGLARSVTNWQTGSSMMLGASLLLAATSAGLLAVRF